MEPKPEPELEGRFEKLEKEPPKSKVILYFFRHGKKQEKQPGQSDYDVLLTTEGAKQAYEKGKEIKPQKEVAIAIGSPRKRAQETATRILFAEDFPPDVSFEEMRKKIQEELDQEYRLGPGRVKKIIAEPRLDFTPYEELSKAVKEKRAVKFLVEESDDLILKRKDENATCFTRTAGNVAEIVKKYLTIASAFEKIVKEKPEKYATFGNQLERYLGTHQTVGECFLAKVIEKIKGKEALKEWVEKNQSGFKETEEFSLEIIGGEKILLHYPLEEGKEETLEVELKVIEEIIKEKEEFNRKIQNKE